MVCPLLIQKSWALVTGRIFLQMFPQTALWQFLYFLQLYNSLGQNTQIFEIKITSLTCQAYRWANKPERVFGLQVRCRELDVFKKGMGNLKYLKPSDEGILQFLSNSIEIWSRDQFFHENQLSYIARVKFLLK